MQTLHQKRLLCLSIFSFHKQIIKKFKFQECIIFVCFLKFFKNCMHQCYKSSLHCLWNEKRTKQGSWWASTLLPLCFVHFAIQCTLSKMQCWMHLLIVLCSVTWSEIQLKILSGRRNRARNFEGTLATVSSSHCRKLKFISVALLTNDGQNEYRVFEILFCRKLRLCLVEIGSSIRFVWLLFCNEAEQLNLERYGSLCGNSNQPW